MSTAPTTTPPPAVDEDAPRYMQIAREFIRGIADDTYPLGAHLPTEAELCEQFGISRFTARESIRVLVSAGLVTRRPRIGTVVIAKPDTARYAQEASALPDLLQYARDTDMRFVYIGKVTLGKAQAQEFGVSPGEEWTYALGIRYASDPGSTDAPPAQSRPFCITRLFLNPQLEGIGALLRERKTAVYALIEREYGLAIDRVEQELSGAVLDADDAANLGAPPGAPALRIVRRYYGKQDRLLEYADNVHPSDRFTYRMNLRR
ncbi:GntR family transcriptional regulator [Variovorax sp. dw_308]|uniref:GntR family transcriptional regulator n=1 Tax=Variovorax sp. dw_308 TaxID=2721546 RepID=UPI001C46AA6A